MSGDARRRLLRLLDAALLAAIAAYVLYAAARAAHLQWDLRTYLFAARAVLAGLDPYDPASLAQVAGRTVPLPFLYPPIGLAPFLALAALPAKTAAAAWLAFKFTALAATVVLWRRAFLPAAPWSLIALVAVFGGDGAALADLRAGNVGIVEAALLAGAFAAWTAERPRTFAVCVVAASLFKLVPILYLGLLLVPGPGGAPPRRALAAVALAGFVLLAFGPLLVPGAPWAGGGFLANVPGAFPVGTSNPTLYAMIETFARGRIGDDATRALVVNAAWGAVALAVVAASARWLGRAGRRLPVALGLLEALLSPRLMQYGFVRAGLPLLVFAPTRGLAAWAALVALPGLLRAARMPITETGWANFLPLVLVAGAWLAAFRARDATPLAEGNPVARPTGLR